MFRISTAECHMPIGVDLTAILWGRMARAEGGLVPSGVAYGEGCPLFSRLGGLGSVVSTPSGVRGRFWRILKATERSFLHFYDKICGRQFELLSPYSKFWGTCPPS